MATYRQIHVKLWANEDIEKLSPLAILTFIYLFSNSHRNEAALYRLTIKKISNETNQSPDQSRASLEELISRDLIRYDFEDSVVWIKNALRYQSISPKGIIAIKKDISGIKNPVVEEFTSYYRDLLGGIDTPSIPIPDPAETQAGKGKGKGKGNKPKDQKDLFMESAFHSPKDKPSDETSFNFPDEYWKLVDEIDSLSENKQLDMLVIQYGKKYPEQRKKYFPAGVIKARQKFKAAMDLSIYPSEILKEILFDILPEGETEPAPWDITNGLIANRGLEQTRPQMHYEMARQLERGVIPDADSTAYRRRDGPIRDGTLQTRDGP